MFARKMTKQKETVRITISGHVHNILHMMNIQTTVELLQFVHCQVHTPSLCRQSGIVPRLLDFVDK